MLIEVMKELKKLTANPNKSMKEEKKVKKDMEAKIDGRFDSMKANTNRKINQVEQKVHKQEKKGEH